MQEQSKSRPRYHYFRHAPGCQPQGRFYVRLRDEAAMKLIWLQLREVTKNWKTPAREWHAAKAQFALRFADRFEMHQ